MEEILKQILAEQTKANKFLERIAYAVEGAPEKKKAKTAEVRAEFKPETQADGTKKLVEQPKEPEITIEQLRQAATEYSSAFGMDDLLALNMKLAGAKKLSQVAPEAYPVLYKEMTARLKAQVAIKNNDVVDQGSPVLTLDEVKAKAKTFMDKNGAPALTAILKVMGAEKLSALASEKYPAFVEAISNA